MKVLDTRNGTWEKRFSYIKQIGFDGLIGNCKFQVIRFLKGAELDYHYHKETVEIFVTTKGRGKLFVSRATIGYLLMEEFYYLIEPGDAHKIEATTDLEIVVFKPYEKGDDLFWGKP
jgi:quercetin dioxygenase-like cupin family protein